MMIPIPALKVSEASRGNLHIERLDSSKFITGVQIKQRTKHTSQLICDVSIASELDYHSQTATRRDCAYPKPVAVDGNVSRKDGKVRRLLKTP